jgi:hypothetical protein
MDTLNAPPPDTTTIATLLQVAKNSWQAHFIYLNTRYGEKPYYKSRLRTKNILHFNKDAEDAYCNYQKVSYCTNPASPYGWYKFTAPSGWDLYRTVENVWKTSLVSHSFSVAYDGSIYALYQTNKSKAGFFTYHGYYNFIPEDAKNISLKYGFPEGGRMQEMFQDAFRRIYDEGAHFSKEDAYNAALAYILEGNGVELYRAAPGDGSTFKRYNTTPVINNGKITGFYSTVWQ